eukprot:CAMPEP_0184316364 /NCGR_PEP_ID=MMETSP1049-20130417/89577_1 /TAXON_ID=77928 /ORGANISM="Proteomonas sulcata, Strain CCMP704" /LENGTH=198 /DNA_ID=CAMNT_0026635303 /DNA_START=1 /DNA_END=597 /DNA_ORIENTATION=+
MKASELCKDLPQCFEKYMEYVKGLGFEEDPDYEKLRELFVAEFKERRLKDDGIFDWTGILSRGLLTVGVISARNLAGKHAGGLSNPYCVVVLTNHGQRRKESTRVVTLDLNPLWESLFEFPVSDSEATLEVTVWSKGGMLQQDKFLGKLSFEVSNLADQVLTDGWHQLLKRSNKSNVSGDIHLRLYYRRGYGQMNSRV